MNWNEVPKDKLQELISQVIQASASRDFEDDDERTDFLLNSYTFPVPDSNNDDDWDAFYEDESSPFRQYNDAVWNALHDIDTSTFDVNDDGDDNLIVTDTNNDGDYDTAIIDADSKAEEKEAVKTAKEELGLDNNDKTSIGKTKGELADSETLSDARKKRIAKMSSSWSQTDTQKEIEKAQKHKSDCTCALCKKYHLNGYSANGVGTISDMRQKNILSALIDRRF